MSPRTGLSTPDVKAERRWSACVACVGPNADVKGVSGVLGVEIYLPLHFGQRPESSVVEEVDTGRTPLGFPFRRG